MHYVCDLGATRAELPEFVGLSDLKFEFQVRTLLQHAWAELAHDRNYKFSGKLPREMERQLYLYAGMLEIADKGFDKLASDIDEYAASVLKKTESGNYDSPIDSISLRQFVEKWARDSGADLAAAPDGGVGLGEVVRELSQFGIEDLAALKAIIPFDFAERLKDSGEPTNVYGAVRDWMLIKDWRRFADKVDYDWVVEPFDNTALMGYIPSEERDEFLSRFDMHYDPEDDTP